MAAPRAQPGTSACRTASGGTSPDGPWLEAYSPTANGAEASMAADRLRAGRTGEEGAAAREQAAIDGARTGDKIPGFDPAAAPLGTDEESAGNRFAPEPKNRPRRVSPTDQAADPAGTGRAGYGKQDRLILPVIALLFVLVAAAIVAAGLFGV
jgi:hypothetical protein